MGGSFLIPYAVGGNLTTFAKEHKAVGAIPVLHDIQPFVDFCSATI